MVSFMRDFENVEFRRRGPLSAITRSKISRSLRGKLRRKQGLSAAAKENIRRGSIGAITGALAAGKGNRLQGALAGYGGGYVGGAAGKYLGLKGPGGGAAGGAALGGLAIGGSLRPNRFRSF